MTDNMLEVAPERTPNWREVSSVQELLSFGGLDYDEIPEGVNSLRILSIVDDFEPYFRVKVEFPTPRPGVLELMVARTRFWVDVNGLKEVKSDILWAFFVYAIVQNMSAAAAVSLVRKVTVTTTRLSEDEAELVAVIIGKAGGDPYKKPVNEQAVRKAYANATVSVTELLDSLADKGVIKNRRDGVIQLQL